MYGSNIFPWHFIFVFEACEHVAFDRVRIICWLLWHHVCTVGLLLLLCLLWTLLWLFLTATVVSTIQRVWCTAIPARSGSVMGVAIHPAGASSACLYLIACRNRKVKLLITWNDNNEIFTHFCQHQPYFDRQVMWHVCNERSVRSRWQLLYLHWLNRGRVQVYLL